MRSVDRFLVDNGAGYRLALTRHRDAARTSASTRPVLIVPGYGMNSFIFDYHPEGTSLVGTLASRGLEVWTVDLRGQGRAERTEGPTKHGLAELAIDDLGVAVNHVLSHTMTGANRLDLVGASLGTALSFAHVACIPAAPVHAIVSLAGLVTWKAAHPLVRLAFGSPELAGMVRIKHTRELARVGLPLVAKVAPNLLSLYLNHRSTDLSRAADMVQTIEDPHPVLNREIAQWLARKELVIRGVNVSRTLGALTHPFLCVVANDDGIVLPATSRHTYEVIGSANKKLLLVGDRTRPIAHGDLFVGRDAPALVFEPVAEFLLGL